MMANSSCDTGKNAALVLFLVSAAMTVTEVSCFQYQHQQRQQYHYLRRQHQIGRSGRSTFGIPRSRSSSSSSSLPLSSPLQQEEQNGGDENIYNSVFVPKNDGVGSRPGVKARGDDGLSLGAPPLRPTGGHIMTRGGVQVTANVRTLTYVEEKDLMLSEGPIESLSKVETSGRAVSSLIEQLDYKKGVLFSSAYEYPGRYTRWTMGFIDPPVSITGSGYDCTIEALNARGEILMEVIIEHMKSHMGKNDGDDLMAFVENYEVLEENKTLQLGIKRPMEAGTFTEEDRSRQPSLFSVVRALVDLFGYNDQNDKQLGLYGAFGYDLTFQFEPIKQNQERDPNQRDLVLYLPDEIAVVDQERRDAWVISYEFCVNGKSTQGLSRDTTAAPFESFDEVKDGPNFSERDTPKGEFTRSVKRAKEEFAVGNLFEAVLSQTFRRKLNKDTPPSILFRRLRVRNPSPYGFFINLGKSEYLVGASPEMFVRCEPTQNSKYRPGALRVETCPISGTVSRGADALEDALNIKSLMMNAKEESELTMCTDVDRNDKSRICEPGSVQVIGRRQIEMYSRLIHTVDHVEGYLRAGFDSLDAFLCHTWAVTVTGAPKTWAIQFVEDNERSPRSWYGAAVGHVGFDGSLNTGLTLRTVRVKNGTAEVRAGATLLFDSNPSAEEEETELKASAMIDAIVNAGGKKDSGVAAVLKNSQHQQNDHFGTGKNVVLIDHEDSFVHTLGNYLRQTGAKITTMRSGHSTLLAIEKMVVEGNAPDMVVLSPGPGNPKDFGLSQELDLLIKNRIPVFGVCLGLQGMVEHFGGTLGVLTYPMHGKPSQVHLTRHGKEDTSIFSGLPESFEVGRYHSLHGIRDCIPECLQITAVTDDGIVMGIQHKTLPIAGVQFHPESILTGPQRGIAMLKNALQFLKYEIDGTEKISGSQLVGNLEALSVAELKRNLADAGMSSGGSKSELILRLALWQHKRDEVKAGRLLLGDMKVASLKELKKSLGVRITAKNKGELVTVLSEILQVS